jgi:hypothetical protein
MKSFCHSLIPFLPYLLNHHRLPSSELDPYLNRNYYQRPPLLLLYPFGTGHTENSLCTFEKARLLIRYIATDVLLRALAPGIFLASRCLAMGIHVTILSIPDFSDIVYLVLYNLQDWSDLEH